MHAFVLEVTRRAVAVPGTVTLPEDVTDRNQPRYSVGAEPGLTPSTAASRPSRSDPRGSVPYHFVQSPPRRCGRWAHFTSSISLSFQVLSNHGSSGPYSRNSMFHPLPGMV